MTDTQVVKQIKKLSPKNGDLLVVYVDESYNSDYMNKLNELLTYAYTGHAYSVLVLPASHRIELYTKKDASKILNGFRN